MKQLIAVLTFVLLGGTSCLLSVQDLPLGSIDGGATGGGATGGGMAGGGNGGGGGAAQGGGQGGGGGGSVVVNPDAGLVTPLARLPEPSCGRVESLGATPCPQDAGICISLLRSGQAEVNVMTEADIPAVSNFGSLPIAPAGNGFLFSVRTTTESSLYYARAGAAPYVLQTAPQLEVLAVADSPSYGFWYIAEPTSLTGLHSRDLMLVTGATSGGAAIGVFPNLPEAPTSNAVAVGSNYFVAFSDGLHSFYPAGGGVISPLTSVTGESERILHIAANTTDIVYLQCTMSPVRCAVRRFDRATNQTTTLLRDLTRLMGGVMPGASVAVTGGHAYVLGVLQLLRVPLTGGPAELIYAGEDFPQYTGTLRGNSLEAIDGKVYFGSVCRYDADAPTYGAVEIDPATLTARWLELDPDYPFVPHLQDGVFNRTIAWRAPAGVFVAR
ncbi:MAG: hypothetical protein Q8N23_11350 [Archangium sp.]|nr:hypothetical protein [Archangium sp.]MDP3153260.1 hypothetical protein [Archangium sp.]MDP3570294.1 hypothetical protein [Archangium sp.]